MTDDQLQATSQDVERIRDIIFGTQMRSYQQRFEVLQQELARLRQDIENLTERLANQERSQEKKAEALRSEACQATDDLRNELREATQRLSSEKVERIDLGQLLLKIGNHLTEGRSLGDLPENLAEVEHDSKRDG